MSWSTRAVVTSVEEIDAIGFEYAPSPEVFQETSDQLNAAKAAVVELVGNFGLGGEKYQVSISGHANANHENPTVGWANEFISVNVYVVTDD